MNLKPIMGLAAAVLVAACTPEAKDVAYFQANPTERDAKIAACIQSGAAVSNDKECQAALAAEEVKPVSYWQDNKEERKQRRAFCKEYKATVGTMGNCINADAAQRKQGGGGTIVPIQ